MWSHVRHLVGAGAAVWALIQLAAAGFACLSNPCLYGICMDDINSSYTCYCIDGYTGLQCQTNWDECWSSPCLNGGTCTDGVAAFNCSCPDGFTGEACEENMDECGSNPCMNNATCVDVVNGYECTCQPGYTGMVCETDIAVCNSTGDPRCLNGGLCEEGPGDSYSCLCGPGWTGMLCGVPTDECISSPCMNGGVCVDLHANYACACPVGFTGKDCEVKLHPCVISPCQNSALCLVEGDTRVCYCVPDYHGDRCQYQYDECKLGPRCMNGGTCLDGIDNFTCSCPPNLTGTLCECLIIGPGELDCTYVRPTTTPSTSPPVPSSPVFTTTETSPPEMEATSITSKTSPEISTSPEPSSTSAQEGPSSRVPSSSTLPVTSGQTTSATEDIFVSTTSNMSYFSTTSTTTRDNTSTVSEPIPIFTTTEPPIHDATQESMSTHHTDSFTLPVTPHSVTHTGVTTSTSGEETTFKFPPVLEHSTEDSRHRTPDVTVETTTVYNKTTSFPSTHEVASTSDTTNFTFTAHVPTDLAQDEHSTTPWDVGTPKFSTDDFPAPVSSTTPSIFANTTLGWLTPEFTTLGISTPARVPSETPSTRESTAEEIPATWPLLTTPSDGRPVSLPHSTGPPRPTPRVHDTTTIPTAEVGSTEFTFTSELSTEVATPFTTDTGWPDCTVHPCGNGGMCVHTTDGPKCSCKFGWGGPTCGEPAGIRVAAFTGQSHLTHRLDKGEGTRVQLVAKTLAPTGIILYAQPSSDKYICLYLEDGLLKFQFSCGVQTMLFSEVEMHVNNGFEMTILAELDLLPSAGPGLRRCSASLRINATLVMSGEQLVSHPLGRTSGGLLHLAGVPRHLRGNTEAPDIAGFTGCMHSLKVNNRTRHIFKDAVDGLEVTECASLACLSSPCHGGATCMEHRDHWLCLCPSGFVGLTCEQSVCVNNPCQFGATCVPFPGSGFLCLCPLGKHGIFCENDLEIGQPSFFSTAGGLASYVAYPLPGAIHKSLELRFHFTPTTMEQIALMVFVGQEGAHDSRADHLAVSFIKGYVVLTWNLGSGPRRIFTPRPVAPRPGDRPHYVRLGRAGQTAWLLVDNFANVTGRSPGRLTQLNTRSVLYLGGHESRNFSLLPHDLPLHSGFAGCLFDVELRAGRATVALQRTRAATGRGVGQCGTSECHDHACQHGGVCLHHGATFTCLCPDGWFGPVCAQRFNPCDSSRHGCQGGSTCVPLPSGYECDCPLGRTGRYCDTEEQLSDARFTGRRSYAALRPADLSGPRSCLQLQVKPLTAGKGLLLFVGHRDGRSFLCLSLHGGVLELRVYPGSSRRRADPLVLRSGRTLAVGEWHQVAAGRYGRRFYLRVDGAVTSAALLPGETLPVSDLPLYLGGLPDMSWLPRGAVPGHPEPLSGCVRRLSLDGVHRPLGPATVLHARNVADCDGTRCGGELCGHGGTCLLDDASPARPRCLCPQQYTGERCETQLSCVLASCHHDGRCDNGTGFAPRCHCPAGWGGAFCEEHVNTSSPHFAGDGYMVVRKTSPPSKRHGATARNSSVDIEFLYLNFSTAEPDGMILWSDQGEDYVGVGVAGALVKLAWSQAGREGVLVLAAVGPVSDGAWHSLALAFSPGDVSLWLDGRLAHAQQVRERRAPPSTDGVFYLGGFPEQQVTLEKETRGHFAARFVGCIRELSWTRDGVISDFSGYGGENIGSCDLY